jgi:DNA-binding cell septation regulator SpoVG
MWILGEALQRKLIVAIAERDKQVKNFKEINKTISRDVREHWTKMINTWLEDESQPNPYILKRKGELASWAG